MKEWWKSSTIWLNLLGLLAEVLAYIKTDPILVNNERTLHMIALALFIINVLNRFKTKDPISLKKVA